MLADSPAATGPQIARQANFYWNLTPRQFFDQLSILPGREPVSDTLSAEV